MSELLGNPDHYKPEDEYLHAAPPDIDVLYGDTVWLSCMQPDAGVMGISHFHTSTNRGYGRFQSHFWIDGAQQSFAEKHVHDFQVGDTAWGGRFMLYEVVEPFDKIRVTCDGPRLGYELVYTARSPVFEYDDCLNGSPLRGLGPAAQHHGGHIEQALQCEGTLEIRSGPRAGEVREINTKANRDHTWSDRFGGITPWETRGQPDAAMHFWLVLCFEERNFQATGFFDIETLGLNFDPKPVGAVELRPDGNIVMADCVADPQWDAYRPEMRKGYGPTRWRFTYQDGKTIHIRVTHVHARCKLLMLGEDDLESRLDDWEQFVELEIEETGEKGHGVLEHSVLPPRPRWLI